MADHNVTIRDFAYDPKDVEIKQGDRVLWTNEDGTEHTVTGDNGEFDSGDIANGAPPFAHVFDTVGTVGYHCDHHGGMEGSVIVSAAEKPYK